MHRGYTLVEVVVCVLIIAVLSTFAMVSFKNTDSTKAAAAARMAAQINNVAMIYKQETGVLPKEQSEGVVPQELSEYFQDDFFQRETPIGGVWDWNAEGSDSGSEGISVFFGNGYDESLLQLVDKLVDDGDLNGGFCFLKKNGQGVFLQFSLDDANLKNAQNQKQLDLPPSISDLLEADQFGMPVPINDAKLSK